MLEKPTVDKKIEKKIEKANEKISDVGGGIKPGLGHSTAHATVASLDARLGQVESLLTQLIQGGSGGASADAGGGSRDLQPFIGSELRPDLSQGALMGEDDYSGTHEDMQGGSAMAKRHFDKTDEH